jgi:hypothetical protein
MTPFEMPAEQKLPQCPGDCHKTYDLAEWRKLTVICRWAISTNINGVDLVNCVTQVRRCGCGAEITHEIHLPEPVTPSAASAASDLALMSPDEKTTSFNSHAWDDGRPYGGGDGWSWHRTLFLCKTCGLGRTESRDPDGDRSGGVTGPFRTWDGVTACSDVVARDRAEAAQSPKPEHTNEPVDPTTDCPMCRANRLFGRDKVQVYCSSYARSTYEGCAVLAMFLLEVNPNALDTACASCLEGVRRFRTRFIEADLEATKTP